MAEFQVKDRRDLPVFIHAELDDFGLDPFEFRVYARVARRTGNGGMSYESAPNIAKSTQMGERKVRYALKVLTAVGLVCLVEAKRGETRVYTLNQRSDWCNPADVASLREKTLKADAEKKPKHLAPAPDATTAYSAAPLAPDAIPPLHDMPETPAPDATKGSPLSFSPEVSPSSRNVGKKSRPPFQTQKLFEIYNENRAALPRADLLSDNRVKNLSALIRQHGFETAQLLLADATRFVATDSHWLENRYGLDNLLRERKGYVVEKAEKYRATALPKLSGRDVKNSVSNAPPDYGLELTAAEMLSGPLEGRWGRR